jgi:hypothetical protein
VKGVDRPDSSCMHGMDRFWNSKEQFHGGVG